jgi:predicted MFS family arabinose efflux permease
MNAINHAGALAAMVIVLVIFEFDLLSYRGTFVLAGLMALVAAVAIFRFPNLSDGKAQEVVTERPRYVLRREYRFYYYLTLLDGARQQIFFSFGLFVLVSIYGMSVPEISILLITVRLMGMLTGPWIGSMIDRRGEKQMLSIVNIGYIVALAGYAFVDSVYLASFCYLIYAFIMPLSGIGSATYLRKVAVRDEIAPSLAMGVTLQHAAAVIVPVTAGIILTFVGYQIPFLIACVFASFTIIVTRRLDPASQKSPARLAQDKALAQVGLEQGVAATAD